MKKSQNIIPSQDAKDNNNWLMEVSKAGIDVLFYTTHPFSVTGLVKYECNELDIHEKLPAYLAEIAMEDWANAAFQNADICLNFAEVILYPQRLGVDTDVTAMMDTTFGINHATKLLEETVDTKDITVYYRTGKDFVAQCSTYFPAATFHSSTALQLSMLAPTASVLRVDVYVNFIKLILFKDGELQTVVLKDYVTANDVIFYMLQLCTLYQLSVLEVKVLCTGMVLAEGNLYLAINNYFSDVGMPVLDDEIKIAPGMRDIEPGFFYNLTMLASCVS